MSVCVEQRRRQRRRRLAGTDLPTEQHATDHTIYQSHSSLYCVCACVAHARACALMFSLFAVFSTKICRRRQNPRFWVSLAVSTDTCINAHSCVRQRGRFHRACLPLQLEYVAGVDVKPHEASCRARHPPSHVESSCMCDVMRGSDCPSLSATVVKCTLSWGNCLGVMWYSLPHLVSPMLLVAVDHVELFVAALIDVCGVRVRWQCCGNLTTKTTPGLVRTIALVTAYARLSRGNAPVRCVVRQVSTLHLVFAPTFLDRCAALCWLKGIVRFSCTYLLALPRLSGTARTVTALSCTPRRTSVITPPKPPPLLRTRRIPSTWTVSPRYVPAVGWVGVCWFVGVCGCSPSYRCA